VHPATTATKAPSPTSSIGTATVTVTDTHEGESMRTIKLGLASGTVALALSLLAIGCKGGAASSNPADLCKKLGELASKEGGDALKMWNKDMKDDCEKQVEKDKKKLGDAKFAQMVTCVNGKDSFTAAVDCAQ
jgi:hypothetical protein